MIAFDTGFPSNCKILIRQYLNIICFFKIISFHPELCTIYNYFAVHAIEVNSGGIFTDTEVWRWKKLKPLVIAIEEHHSF